MSKYITFLFGIGLIAWPVAHCQAQPPFIPKDLSNEPYSQAWTFLPNQGQVYDLEGDFRDGISFHSVGTMPTVYVWRDARTSITFPDIHEEDSTLDRVARLDMWLEGAESRPPMLVDEVPMRYNFYEQYTPEGITDVTGGKRVLCEEVYEGIDYHIFSNDRGPKFLLVIRPNADPDNIIFRFAGQDSLDVDILGFLKLHADDKELIFPEGLVYQQQDQTVIPIPWTAEYDLQGQAIVRLVLGEYNHDLPLMILIQPLAGMGGGGGGEATPPEWSTYMAGAGYDDAITDLTHDNEGNLYFTGYSRSTSGLPIDAGISLPLQGGNDVILGRVNDHYEIQTPETWMTYYGGNGYDEGNAIAYDAENDRLAVCGNSDSDYDDLVYPNGYVYSSNGDGLIALFDLGGHLQYSTRLPLTLPNISDLDVDQEGNTYVVGHGFLGEDFDYVDPPGTVDYSTQQGPMIPGWLGHDALVMKFNPEMNLVWSTALGGPGDDVAKACAVDNSTGTLYVVGSTNTPNDLSLPDCPVTGWYDYPLCNQYGGYLQDLLNGSTNAISLGQDGFITAFDNNTLEMVWSTYLGSPAGIEAATDVAVDKMNNVYVTGFTNMSSSSSQCVWEPSLDQFIGCDNGQYFNDTNDGYGPGHFIYRFDGHHDMTWGTFISGGHQEYFGSASRVRVTCDSGSNVFLYGSSSSTAFPDEEPVLPETVNGAFYNQGGNADAPQPVGDQQPFDTYIGGFGPDGQLFYSSYFGGYGNDYANAIAAFDDRVYISGSTAAAMNFPTHAPNLPGYQPYLNPTPSASNSDRDGFLAQVKYDFAISVNEQEGLNGTGLQLYPNPATDELTVQTGLSNLSTIEILNTLGQVVLRQPLQNSSASLDVGALPQASYIVRALGPTGSTYARFIKQ